MTKITLEKGSLGNWTAYIDGIEVEHAKNSISLDREDLLEEVLATIGIEVETKWHHYVTNKVNGVELCVRVDDSRTNMKETVK